MAKVDSSSHRLSDWSLSSKTGAASPDRGQRDLGLPVGRWGQHWGGVILVDLPSLPPHSALSRADPQVPQWKSFLSTFKCFNLLPPPRGPEGGQEDTQAQSN